MLRDESRELLLVTGTGGHGEQMKRLRRLLSRPAVIIAEGGFQWPFPDELHCADRIVDYHKRSLIQSIVNFIRAARLAHRVLRRYRPRVVVSTGPALAVPVCVMARLHGKTVIHIESWSRIASVSNTTRILRTLGIPTVTAYQYKDSVLAAQKNCEYWGHL